MEDVLDVYARPVDPRRPLLCLDEFCKQLLSEKQKPVPAAPGRVERYDYEYVREGVVSAFMLSAPHLGKREVIVGKDGRRTTEDFAKALEYAATEMFPDSEKIILVMDNLNTHRIASLYSTFEPKKANALAKRFEIHYTPKHGSWLNIAELEISVLARTCINRRISSLEEFRAEIGANVAGRNEEARPTNWQFTSKDARIKLHRLYPQL